MKLWPARSAKETIRTGFENYLHIEKMTKLYSMETVNAGYDVRHLTNRFLHEFVIRGLCLVYSSPLQNSSFCLYMHSIYLTYFRILNLKKCVIILSDRWPTFAKDLRNHLYKWTINKTRFYLVKCFMTKVKMSEIMTLTLWNILTNHLNKLQQFRRYLKLACIHCHY